MRYAHNATRVLSLPTESVALLATLMLRGAQTSGEIRINCERLHRFADISSVENYLSELEDRAAGALVAELPRVAGSRESRWMHLLSGPAPSGTETAGPLSMTSADAVGVGEIAAIKHNLSALGHELAEVRAALARVMDALGMK